MQVEKFVEQEIQANNIPELIKMIDKIPCLNDLTENSGAHMKRAAMKLALCVIDEYSEPLLTPGLKIAAAIAEYGHQLDIL